MKNVYFFSEDKTEGSKELRDLLGGKGANLAEMSRLGVSVPPGFTITTEVCTYYYAHEKKYPKTLRNEVEDAIREIEKRTRATFGDPQNPLLVSVRSGARVSMPGMMDTILNLGLNDETVEGLSRKTGDPRFSYDSYRRFVQMYGDVVCGVPGEKFEEVLESKKKSIGVETDSQIDLASLKQIIAAYKEFVDVPQSSWDQLWGAIGAVFSSWNNKRAISYRELHGFSHDWGTAVNVMAMVFGNKGVDSGTGVCFSRDPTTGENVIYGEYLENAQGEDVVAGIRTPNSLRKERSEAEKTDSFEELMPENFAELVMIVKKLEDHYRDIQDIEFTVEEGKLWILQTRSGKRTARAAVKVARDMVEEGLVKKEEAILRLDLKQIETLLHPTFATKKEALAKGQPASPGAARGKVVFDPETAEKMAEEGEKTILVRIMTSPEDIRGMAASEGILTKVGGLTSHAALVSRGLGKCCVVGCAALAIDYKKKEFRVGETLVKEGDVISLDGSTGEVMLGELPVKDPVITEDFNTVLSWADEARTLGVRTNADTPSQVAKALEYGAEGVGLCRTEHMFFEEDRIDAFRAMILSEDETEQKKWLDEIFRLQKHDFKEIFRKMQGKEVTVRLLDPPLHEFLPEDSETMRLLAGKTGISEEDLEKKIHGMREQNPMLGHRGVRLGITHPEIYRMQVRAICEAAKDLKNDGIDARPEIMLPLVATKEEFKVMARHVREVMDATLAGTGITIPLGMMIEVPEAALKTDELVHVSDFFSFGTNDLTQMTKAISRDDVGTFYPKYMELCIWKDDPFSTIEPDGGVAKLMKIAVDQARKSGKSVKIGICGEHGGDPATIVLCNELGLDYVSASPYRVPIARLAAAQAAIKSK